MSPLSQAVADYLTMRRALGYRMDKTERLLGQFVAFVEGRGETHIRTATALAWRPGPQAPPRSGTPDVWPRFASSPGTSAHSTR
jgi:hypothetical protein